MNKGFTGDAELKKDWIKPPTALNAMGFYSSSARSIEMRTAWRGIDRMRKEGLGFR